MPKDTTQKPARKLSVPAAQTTAVTTNLPPPTDQEICNELMTIQGKLVTLRSLMTVTVKALIRCHLGTIKILPIYEEMIEKLDDQKRQFDMDIGELTLLGSCPVNCLYHMEFDPLNTSKILNDEAREELVIFEKQIKSEIAAKNKPQPLKEIKDKTEAVKDTAEAKSVVKKNTRTVCVREREREREDFVSPTKFAKKQKVVKNDSVGATAPIKITNQYQALAGNSTLPDPDTTVVPVAAQKYPPLT
ncbi:hypothetical protein TNIN_148581 [Trichonephila inaurata madagascariensis]|uniref:Uncharacterized protein n=1 Tax=Trichonephila inaurata madagascariensis TaxID=2747483 RepID=A0A8X6XHR3_9ARAC|nr:hypothetical protein TNIN_148581 [Trichonephila inaurata madagascariensis]